MAGNIMNPPTPFVGNLPGPLTDRTSIVVTGYAPPDHPDTQFVINLACGKQGDANSDLALHFNPRFNQSSVVRNSQQNGQWGKEETHGSFPFQKGTPFEVVINATPDMYKISVNRKHFCDYNHRVPMHRVNTLSVQHGIQITNIRFDGFPVAYPGLPAGGAYQPPNTGFFGGNEPIYNPAVPFTSPVPGGVYPGRMINISGIPHPNSKHLSVNLQCGQDASADIALHIDVRFDHQGDHHQIVRNSKQNGQWGQEERQLPHFPFGPNSNFDMLILCEANSFKIAVNNQHLTEMTHRISQLNRIDTMQVKGDFRITQVRFQ